MTGHCIVFAIFIRYLLFFGINYPSIQNLWLWNQMKKK